MGLNTERELTTAQTTEFFDSLRTGRLSRLRHYLEEDPALLRAVDSNGETPVLEALYYGQPGALEVLLERTSELDIFEAAALGRAGRIRELLDADAALAAPYSPDGYTPLHLAAFFGRTDAVRILLERGADPNVTSHNGRRQTPLHGAASRGHLESARLLLDNGAEPNARDSSGETAMHVAARSFDKAMLDLLESCGGDQLARNEAGETPNDVITAPTYNESE